MPFEPGHPKFGGRKLGTPNKRTSSARERLVELGVDPIEYMAKIVADDSAETSLRLMAAKELAQYSFPKLRASEIAVSSNSEREWSSMSTAELREKALRLAKKIVSDDSEHESDGGNASSNPSGGSDLKCAETA